MRGGHVGMVRGLSPAMRWTFRRGNELLLLEMNYDRDLGEFVLRWNYASGGQDYERYTNDFTFRRRLLQLEDDLREWGWSLIGPSAPLRDGWQRL